MCLILFGIDTSPEFPLILAANRDEFYDRPTRAMEFWPDRPDILAGKDLQAGGTWMGISRQGRFAALTNYRDLSNLKPDAPSRGELILRVLEYMGSVPEALKDLDETANRYNGFNLLAGEAGQVFCYSNRNRTRTRVNPGIHGLSNHLIDTPWPKVANGKTQFKSVVDADPADNDGLFKLLTDTTRPDDSHLPSTGIGLEWERILSPLFIQSPTYGTRSSTLMRVSRSGEIQVVERTFGNSPREIEDRKFSLYPPGP
ncbi:MAG: NRDE family protein [Desulfobacterales bacterium]|nr:NRDE family protein [Desulfobacterales bacterium]